VVFTHFNIKVEPGRWVLFLLNRGMDIRVISEIVGISEKEVREIK